MLLKICDSFKPVFCNKTAATLLGRESQLMWYSWLRTALHGAIQAVIKVKEDRKSVLWRRISWMGFQTDLPNFPLPREPSIPIQKWKPFFYSRFSQLVPKQLYKSSRLPVYNESGASITQRKMKYVGGSRELQNPVAPDVVAEFESKAASILQWASLV